MSENSSEEFNEFKERQEELNQSILERIRTLEDSKTTPVEVMVESFETNSRNP